MDLSNPLAAVTPTADGPVLAVLAGADTDFTTGQVQRLIGDLSLRGVRLVLDRLAEQGIVTRRQAGRAWLYRLNREHLAADCVIALAGARDRLMAKMADTVGAWSRPPVYAALYGSGVHDRHTSSSDIDLFLVRPDSADADTWETQVDDLAAAVTRWTGNDTRPLVLSESDITRWAGRDEPALSDIADHGIAFHGDTAWLRAWLRDARRAGTTRIGRADRR